MQPNPQNIRAFPTQHAFALWLRDNHNQCTELWLKIHKKASGLPTVTYAQALDVALCWGWIDGLKHGFDETSFLQRFTPRKAKSIWSQLNVGHVQRLTLSGEMQPEGQRHVDAAKADGRWQAAYASGRTMEMPADLVAAVQANPQALALFNQLNAVNRYALAFRLAQLKTEAGRRKRIADNVAKLARGETPYPNGN